MAGRSNLLTIGILAIVAFAGYKLLTDKGGKMCAQGGPKPTDAPTHWDNQKCCWALDSTQDCYEYAQLFYRPGGNSPPLTGYGPPPPSGVGLGWY